MTKEEKTIYLYGRVKDWGEMSYDDALKHKIRLADIQLEQELLVNVMERDIYRVNEIIKSIKFNNLLLNE